MNVMSILESAPLCPRLVFEVEDALGPLPALYDRLAGQGWHVGEVIVLAQVIAAFDSHDTPDLIDTGRHVIAANADACRRAGLRWAGKILARPVEAAVLEEIAA